MGKKLYKLEGQVLALKNQILALDDERKLTIRKLIEIGVNNIYDKCYHELGVDEDNYKQELLDKVVHLYCFEKDVGDLTVVKLRKKGRELSLFEKERYGESAMLRYVAGSNEPVYPIGYIRYKIPRAKKPLSCIYSIKGRKGLHNNLRVNMKLLLALMKESINGRSIEYADNRIALFSAQWGKCAVTGRDFLTLEDIHCHHKKRRSNGGGDEYSNLVLVLKPIHILIHATDPKLITTYLKLLNLNKSQLDKLNKFREMAGCSRIA